MKYLKLFENIKDHKNICVDLYKEIGPYFNGTIITDDQTIQMFRYLKEINIIKNYKQILDDYLTDLQDEFPYEFSLGDSPQLDGRDLYRIRYEFSIPKNKYDVFMDVMDESIFDRIKDEYPDQNVYYRFYITTGKSVISNTYPSSWHGTPHSSVDELKTRISSFVNGNVLFYNKILLHILFT